MSSEILYPDEASASQSYKLVRLARALRTQWINNPKAEINLYGYISKEAEYSNVKEKDERASMRQRFNVVQDILKQMGVPQEKAWVGGIAFSPNRGGQIDLFIRDGKSTFILPPYPPAVAPSYGPPKAPSDSREPWLDSDAEIGVNPKDKEVEVEVSVKYEGDPLSKIVQPALKCVFREDGSLKEVGAEINLLKAEIAKKIAGFRDVEIAVKTSRSAEFSKRTAERQQTELHTKFKAELSANVHIPGTHIKMPVKLSVDVDPKGELGISALITVVEF